MGQCLSALQEVVEGSTSELASGGGGGVPSTTATDGLLSPLYPSLPEGAEKVQVRNVYDGDTLTLIDERRVRFLGIDTPELKEKQPFAEEAKVYTKNLCHKQEIWISYEPGHEKQDHYGRLLCFVWVQIQAEVIYLSMKALYRKDLPTPTFLAKIPSYTIGTNCWNCKIKPVRPRRDSGVHFKTLSCIRRSMDQPIIRKIVPIWQEAEI